MPPPPPAKPSPASSTSSIQSFGNVTSNVASSSSIGRSNPPPQQSGHQQPNVDRRNPAQDNYTPPIVVVSPEMPSDPLPHQKPTPHLPGEPATPPRATTTLNNRLRQAPKDTIPMVGKPPRKQRNSRFHVTEKVEIERLPAFNGMYTLHSCLHGRQAYPNLQRSPYTIVLNYSSGNCINVLYSLTLTTQVLNSAESKLKHRPFTKCSTILQHNEV